MLYIVSTPIGNLKDVTLRALEVLKSADLIAAEDTRHSKILTSHYQIKTPITSYYEHNKITKGEYLLRLLKEGKNIALISDAGTPGISDPGFSIIRLAIENNILVCSIPGPSALITGLVISGLPTDKFIFEGFLPAKSTARRRRLQELSPEKRTICFYESPHRLFKTLSDILEILGDINITCVRELTKKFEEIKRGRVSEIAQYFAHKKPKGEFIVYIQNKQ